MEANKALLRLQELHFGALEIRQYLDTHPLNIKAQQDFTNLTCQIQQQLPIVEKTYGPISQYGCSRENPVRWIEEPWPWELTY